MNAIKLKVFLTGFGFLPLVDQKRLYDIEARKLELMNLEVVKPCDIQAGREMSELTKCNTLYICTEHWPLDDFAKQAFRYAAIHFRRIYLQNQYNILVQEYVDKIIC